MPSWVVRKAGSRNDGRIRIVSSTNCSSSREGFLPLLEYWHGEAWDEDVHDNNRRLDLAARDQPGHWSNARGAGNMQEH